MNYKEQDGFVSETELVQDLKSKINNADTNAKNAKVSIGLLSNLKTTDKSSLVNSINEVANNVAINSTDNNTSISTINSTIGSATLNTSDKTLKGAINEVKNKVDTNDNVISAINNTIGYTELKTTDKTVKGAINEVFQCANNAKSNLASVIGSPVTSSDTFDSIKNNIQNAKNILADNVKSKGVRASADDTLNNLVNLVANISLESLGGGKLMCYQKEIQTGTKASSGVYDPHDSTSEIHENRLVNYTIPPELRNRFKFIITTGALNSIVSNVPEYLISIGQQKYPSDSKNSGWWNTINFDRENYVLSAGSDYLEKDNYELNVYIYYV